MQKSGKILLIVLLLNSCAIQKQPHDNRSVNFKILAGINKGGIVENTDFSIIESIQPDAFSGATKIGYHLGTNIDIPLKKNNIETGLNTITNKHIFTYKDLKNNYTGQRNLSVTQIKVPVSFNLLLFKQRYPNNLFQLKFGYSWGYSIINVHDMSNTLPSYSVNHFSGGILLGLNVIPIAFSDNSKLGCNIELFRAFKASYIDFYNVGKMPGLSYLKFSILYVFKHKY